MLLARHKVPTLCISPHTAWTTSLTQTSTHLLQPKKWTAISRGWYHRGYRPEWNPDQSADRTPAHCTSGTHWSPPEGGIRPWVLSFFGEPDIGDLFVVLYESIRRSMVLDGTSPTQGYRHYLFLALIGAAAVRRWECAEGSQTGKKQLLSRVETIHFPAAAISHSHPPNIQLLKLQMCVHPYHHSMLRFMYGLIILHTLRIVYQSLLCGCVIYLCDRSMLYPPTKKIVYIISQITQIGRYWEC